VSCLSSSLSKDVYEDAAAIVPRAGLTLVRATDYDVRLFVLTNPEHIRAFLL